MSTPLLWIYLSAVLSFLIFSPCNLFSQCITVLRIHAVAGIFLPRHWKNYQSQLKSQWFWEPLVHAIHIYQESTHPGCVSNLINRSLYQTSSSVKRESDIFSSTSVTITRYFTGGSFSAVNRQPTILFSCMMTWATLTTHYKRLHQFLW